MTDRIISCDGCREVLSAKSDGEVSASESAALAHLETCAACREFRDDLDTVRSALRGWADEVPQDNARLLMMKTPRQTRVFRRLAAAAVFVVAIAVGFAAGRASAPVLERNGGSTGVAPSDAPPVERERYVVPERNEIYSTIRLAAVEAAGPDNPERSHR